MKIVIAGGSGSIGKALSSHFKNSHQVVVLTRSESKLSGEIPFIHWDGKSLGPWTVWLEGADVLINLTGKSVDCRYTKRNKQEILSSRLDSTRALGEAMESLKNPPRLWIQASSATIYQHTESKPMDEWTGKIGDDFSMNVCKQWERSVRNLTLEHTRKVILRIGIVLTPDGGALPSLRKLCKVGLGGQQGSGAQFVSWIHIDDLIEIVDWVISQPNPSSIYNCCSPYPVRNSQFMASFRKALNIGMGLALPRWLLELGAWLIRTETELILKSRWVLPVQLLKDGFRFHYPHLEDALEDLLNKSSHDHHHIENTDRSNNGTVLRSIHQYRCPSSIHEEK